MKAKHKLLLSVSTLISMLALVAYIQRSDHTLQIAATSLMISFPDTTDKVDAYVEETITLFDKQVAHFASITDRNYSNTIKEWNLIGEMLLERLITVKSLSIIQASAETIDCGQRGFIQIQDHVIHTLTHTPKIPLTFLSFLETVGEGPSMSLTEWNGVYQLAISIDSHTFPLMYKRKMDEVQISLQEREKTPYQYKMGDAQPKKIEVDEGLTLLNVNVCLLPGKLPRLFGGLLPWPLRIEQVACRIHQLDADIVCLQEVFEEKSAEILYERLKDKYSHFYLSIGPRNFGLSPESLGLGSGLFVASKYPISNASYHPFTSCEDYMKRGVFAFSLHQDNRDVAHIYTTHLAAFNTASSPSYRKKQLEQILTLMKARIQTSDTECPVLLCGDLNIPYSSHEPAEEMLTEHFLNTYNRCHRTLCLENRTCLDLTTLWWQARLHPSLFQPIPEILDYALLLQQTQSTLSDSKFFLYTTTIPMNQIEDPLHALSDHHAQISLINRVDPVAGAPLKSK